VPVRDRFRVAAAFRAELFEVFLPRPEPLFFPPPVSLFTVAQARRSASLRETPPALVAFFYVLGLALLLRRVGRFITARHDPSPVKGDGRTSSRRATSSVIAVTRWARKRWVERARMPVPAR
jgi:hypothetical protein